MHAIIKITLTLRQSHILAFPMLTVILTPNPVNNPYVHIRSFNPKPLLLIPIIPFIVKLLT